MSIFADTLVRTTKAAAPKPSLRCHPDTPRKSSAIIRSARHL
jgi:hypothetical protein